MAGALSKAARAERREMRRLRLRQRLLARFAGKVLVGHLWAAVLLVDAAMLLVIWAIVRGIWGMVA